MPRRYDDEDDYDDRPRRRRYEDDSDDEDDDYRPRPRKKKRPASGPPVALILALVAGLGLLGLLFAGGLFFLLRQPAQPAMAARPMAPPAFNPPPVVVPDPIRPPAPPPGRSEAKKPTDEPTPAANPSITLTAVRRGTSRFGKPSLEIDYTSSQLVHGLLAVKVKGPDGSVTEATLHGPPPGLRPGDTTGTWTIEQFGFSGAGFSGRLQVWVERKMGLRGETVSNVFTVE